MKIKRDTVHALFKKILISISLILLLLNANVSHFNKAKATGVDVTDSPGYVDEFFKSVMTGVMTVGGAATHAGNYVEDNAKAIIDAAGLTYEQLAPEMKQAFKDSMSSAGDRIIIAGDMINAFLGKYEEPMGLTPDIHFGKNVTVHANGTTVASFAHPITLYGNNTVTKNSFELRIEYYKQLSGIEGVFVEIPGEGRKFSAGGTLPGKIDSMSLSQALSYLTAAGWNFDVGIKQPDPIYDQVGRWLRNRADAGGLTLGLPQSVPYTNTGLRLGVNEALGGLTLDGTNLYTGDIVWRDVLPNVAEGALTLPAPYIYNPTGVPLALVDGIPVAPDGTIVNPADVTVSANPITHVREGDTTTTVTNTYTGSTVNTITNEWITYNTYVYEATTGTVTPKPETPPKKPEKKPTSNDGTPNSLLLALLLSMLDLIRAIIWYLIRLFNFVVQLPKTPTIPIPNPIFQWFISTKFVGINVYQSAVYLTTFALSFGIFKVIRRYFND